MIALIVAMDANNLIGADNGLPWHLSADLRRFRRLTMGNALVMGRRTYESIGRPLDGRENIVVSRNPALTIPGVVVCSTVGAAIAYGSRRAEQVFVIGGAQVYREALPQVERIHLTRLHGDFEGDTHFPVLSDTLWRESEREDHAAGAGEPCAYSFITLNRVEAPSESREPRGR